MFTTFGTKTLAYTDQIYNVARDNKQKKMKMCVWEKNLLCVRVHSLDIKQWEKASTRHTEKEIK